MRLGKEKKVAKQRRRKRCRSWPRCPTRVGRSRRSELVQRRECGVEVLAEAGVDGDARPLGPGREIWDRTDGSYDGCSEQAALGQGN